MKFLLLALFVAATTAAPLDAGSDPIELIVNGVPEGEPLEIGDLVDITLKKHDDGEVVAQSNLLHHLTAVGIAEAAAAAEAAAVATPDVPAIDEINRESVSEVEARPEPAAAVEANPESPAVVDVIPESPSVVDASPFAPDTPAIVDGPEAVPESPVVVDAIPESPSVVDATPVAPETPVVLDGPEAIPESPVVVDVIPEPPSVVDASPVAPETPAVVDAPEVPVAPVSPVEVVDVEALPDAAAQAPPNPSGEVYNDGMVQVQVNYPEEGGVLGTLKSWVNIALNYFQDGVSTTQQIL